jgi:hypothetical protein
MRTEALVEAKNKAREDALLPKLEFDRSVSTKSLTGNSYQGRAFDFSNQERTFELE